eukprot:CAMPEP_0195518322 /NCGR_PEP_ID=MMETSP0794_2-20130614/12677_1 /TAXON_ID=515487 /ORGANISM="Stephanopyxis turris, Strain CCMP 815" /LENGTH=398 /DNA_ID=CAMNT_0040647265 /DNA_START=239 /DNA_END=1435 /DNA_ORIENTATION=-
MGVEALFPAMLEHIEKKQCTLAISKTKSPSAGFSEKEKWLGWLQKGAEGSSRRSSLKTCIQEKGSDSMKHSYSFSNFQTTELAKVAIATDTDVVITKLGTSETINGVELLKYVKKTAPHAFRIMYSHTASESAETRQYCSSVANMVSSDESAIAKAISQVFYCVDKSQVGIYSCPWCDASGMTEDQVWIHGPLYHINASNDRHALMKTDCPICNHVQPIMQTHIHKHHGPWARKTMLSEVQRESSNMLYAFGLVVVRHPNGKYLLVQERFDKGYWLPGGGVDKGELLTTAAIRETKEEGGVDIRLTGILQFQFSPQRNATRLRVIFLGEPIDPQQKPKSVPDYESVGAVYATSEEILGKNFYPSKLKFRSGEPQHWVNYLEKGCSVQPLDALLEGDEV